MFQESELQRYGIRLYSKNTTLKIINECEKQSILILGIDGFYITENNTEPSLANSIDVSRLTLTQEEIYIEIKKFLAGKDEALFFEIIFDE